MKNCTTIVFLIAFFPTLLLAKVSGGVIIKTQVLRNLIAENPNIVVEKILNDKVSVELEGIWMRRDKTSNGGERVNQRFYNSQGVAIVLSTKYYFPRKRIIPNANFVSGFIRYNNTTIKNVEKVRSANGLYLRTVDVNRKGPELGFVVGRQFFLLRKVTSEVNIRLGNYWRLQEQRLISGDRSDDFVSGKYKDSFTEVRPYFHLTLGYLIGQK